MLDKATTFGLSDDQEKADRQEKIDQCRADIYRCFAKYGLSLLEASISDCFDERMCSMIKIQFLYNCFDDIYMANLRVIVIFHKET